MSTSDQATRRFLWKPFHTMIALGVVVIIFGLLVPRLLNSTKEVSRPETNRLTDAGSNVRSATTTEGPGFLVSLMKMAVGVAVVAGICIGIARWMRHTPDPLTSGSMQLIASQAIDFRCILHLVQAGNRRLLVGIDPSGVKAVAELPLSPIENLPMSDAEPESSTIVASSVVVPAEFARFLQAR